MQKKMTIQRIADYCCVSVATVSRVLNGKEGVRPEIRERILHFVRDFGWDSNRIESRLCRKTEKHAVVVVSLGLLDSAGPLLPLASLLQSEFGYKVSVVFGSRMELLRECTQTLPELVVLYRISDLFVEIVRELRQKGVQVVTLGESFLHSCPIIADDYRDAGRRAAEDLKRAGIRRIAFAGPLGEQIHPASPDAVNIRSMHDLIAGILDVCPELDPAKDFVSDNYGNDSVFREMFFRKQYAGWIIYDAPLLTTAGTAPESVLNATRIVSLLPSRRVSVPPIAWRTYFQGDLLQPLRLFLKQNRSECPENTEVLVPFRSPGDEV